MPTCPGIYDIHVYKHIMIWLPITHWLLTTYTITEPQMNDKSIFLQSQRNKLNTTILELGYCPA